LARSEVIDGAQLLANIYRSWRAIGLDAEGVARCEAYLAVLPVNLSQLRARLTTALSAMLAQSFHKVRAFALATEAVEHARAGGDASSLGLALGRYANAATYVQRLDDAEEALAQAEALPDVSPLLRFLLLETRAGVSQMRGDLETAARMHEQMRKECRSLGNTSGEQIAAQNLAEIQHAHGQTHRAIAIVRETLLAARAGADKTTPDLLLMNLAGYLAAVDDLPGAVAAACDAIRSRAVREPDHAYVAVAIEHLALVCALGGDCARTATLEGYADVALQRHGFPREFTETTTFERLTALLREGLAPDELARLSAAGAALTPEAAVALALAASAGGSI
jgi:ATP/maltotriose-dependent transcriptional regulator MalT